MSFNLTLPLTNHPSLERMHEPMPLAPKADLLHYPAGMPGEEIP